MSLLPARCSRMGVCPSQDPGLSTVRACCGSTSAVHTTTTRPVHGHSRTGGAPGPPRPIPKSRKNPNRNPSVWSSALQCQQTAACTLQPAPLGAGPVDTREQLPNKLWQPLCACPQTPLAVTHSTRRFAGAAPHAHCRLSAASPRLWPQPPSSPPRDMDRTQSQPTALGCSSPRGTTVPGNRPVLLLYCTREHPVPRQPRYVRWYLTVTQGQRTWSPEHTTLPAQPLPPTSCTEPLLGTPPCRVLAPSTLLQCPEEGDALQGDGADSSCACPPLP